MPKRSKILRRSATTSPFSFGGLVQGDDCFEVASGLSWAMEGFISKAVELGHPANFCKMVTRDIQEAIRFHCTHSNAEISSEPQNWIGVRKALLEAEVKQLQINGLPWPVKFWKALGMRT